jgi:hypothetical protein
MSGVGTWYSTENSEQYVVHEYSVDQYSKDTLMYVSCHFSIFKFSPRLSGHAVSMSNLFVVHSSSTFDVLLFLSHITNTHSHFLQLYLYGQSRSVLAWPLQ